MTTSSHAYGVLKEAKQPIESAGDGEQVAELITKGNKDPIQAALIVQRRRPPKPQAPRPY